MSFWTLFSKFLFVLHDLICMIHGLVLTSHLQDELSWDINTLNSWSSWHSSDRSNLFLVGRYTDILTLFVLSEKSWRVTFPGTKIFHFVLSGQLDFKSLKVDSKKVEREHIFQVSEWPVRNSTILQLSCVEKRRESKKKSLSNHSFKDNGVLKYCHNKWTNSYFTTVEKKNCGKL
jgi:hypothetical protein